MNYETLHAKAEAQAATIECVKAVADQLHRLSNAAFADATLHPYSTHYCDAYKNAERLIREVLESPTQEGI